MKIGLVSDIHGNNLALSAVLDHAKSVGVESYVLLGDYITDCPQPNEVLDRVKELEGWKIRGNREILVLKSLEKESSHWDHHDQMRSLVWTRERLRQDHLDFIKTLKDSMSIQIEGFGSIKIVHGSPHKPDELLKFDREERVKEVLESLEEDVLICGHTHLPWVYTHRGKTLINPGAVGIAFNHEVCAEYAVLEIQSGNIQVEHYKVPYKFEHLKSAFSKSGLLSQSPIWASMVLQSLQDGKNRNVEFIGKVIELMREKNLETKDFFPNAIWQEAYEKWIQIDTNQFV